MYTVHEIKKNDKSVNTKSKFVYSILNIIPWLFQISEIPCIYNWNDMSEIKNYAVL